MYFFFSLSLELFQMDWSASQKEPGEERPEIPQHLRGACGASKPLF